MRSLAITFVGTYQSAMNNQGAKIALVILIILCVVQLRNHGQQPPRESSLGNLNNHLNCFEKLGGPLVQELQAVRSKLIGGASVNKSLDIYWRMDAWKHRSVLASEKGYFEKLSEFQNILTIFLNASLDLVKGCSIRDYYQHTVITNFRFLLPVAKRHLYQGKTMYGMTYERNLSKALEKSSLSEAALDVGMPTGFVQGEHSKTLAYLHVIPNGCVTQDGDVITPEFNIIPLRCYPHRKTYIEKKRWRTVKEVFSIGQYFGGGMFHGNVEDVTRLSFYLQFLQKNPDIFIQVSQGVPVFAELLPLDKSRYISGPVCASVVYMPGGTDCCLPNFISTQITSFYLRRSLPDPAHDKQTIVLIKRSMRRNRYFIHHDKILLMLQEEAAKYDFRVWVFRDDPAPPLLETAAMFNRAVMVVAPHGAGETNLLFSQPEVVLIEALCLDIEDFKVNLVYRNIAHVIGGRYYGYYDPKKHCKHTSPEDLRSVVAYYLLQVIRE
ncbi:hypothetical protein CAPTEDRAFT_200220 [Capitella teleta]|uniref:Glycosyltransferase 61 catalytic domain-containing protein n=1 Tax=Capitella teleta TaxID=283909 RepID=R7V384_CAPTE|nr:hypothetical protein CAPTEDRAFT_200220 [Capitella teleta]|eukprot:ELU10786.1 hypothetical protein CAPTEDRAFT_200220 [Capitella teleta]